MIKTSKNQSKLIGVFKINRYTGKINNNFYGLDRNYFAKYFGSPITADTSEFGSILKRNYNTKWWTT